MPIPIGLDYHSKFHDPRLFGNGSILPALQEAEIRSALQSAIPFSQRKPFAFCDWANGQLYGDRVEALDLMDPAALQLPSKRMPRQDLWNIYANSAFVASPSGVGRDCHRTWEAISLGAVPIIKRSSISRVFDGLPVLQVESWSDVTPKFLETSQKDFENKTFDLSSVFLQYWRDAFRSGEKPTVVVSASLDEIKFLV